MSDQKPSTPAPLSADSLRDALRLYRLKYSARVYDVTNAEERERETEICDAEFIELFNTALQSERQNYEAMFQELINVYGYEKARAIKDGIEAR